MIKRFIFSLVLLLLSSNLYAAIDLTTVTGWSTVLQGVDLDHGNDQQATASIDLLGNATYPMFYMEFDDLGDADASNDEIAFSFRGDKAVDNQGDFNGYLWIGLDFDNDGIVDAFMVLNGDGTASGQTLTVYDSDSSKANNSPSSTSLLSASATSVTNGFFFDHYPAPDISDIDDDGVTFGVPVGDGDPDYIVSYKVNLQALATALNGQNLSAGGTLQTLDGGNGVGLDTPFKIVVSSAQQVNSLNGDMGGYDTADNDDTTLYTVKGAFSPTITYFDADPLDAAQTTVTASPTTIIADGTTTSTITVQAKDAAGVNLTSSAGVLVLSENGSASISAITDNTDGTYTATVTSTVAEVITVSGTINGTALTDTADITFVPGPVSGITTTITVNPASVEADNVSTSVISVQTKDANGNNLTASAGILSLSSTGSAVISAITDEGDGTYTATVKNTVVEIVTITGIIDGNPITDNDTVAFVDTTIPVITLLGATPITIERGFGYFEIGATALDVTDGDITADIVVVNSVNADITGTYTVTFDVDDRAGNSAVQVTRTVIVEDTIGPDVSILNQPASVNNLDAFTVTFQFTEIVNGFDGTEIILTNSTLSNFVIVGGIGDIYTADIKPDSFGDVSVAVGADVAQDASANGNTAAVTQITTFDITPPDVVVTSYPGVNLANQSAYTVNGTCTAGDGDVLVQLSLGPAFFTPFEVCTTGGTWSSTFDLSTLDDTSAGFKISIGARQTDAAGNIGDAVAVEVDKDTVKPNVQIQNVPAFVNANEFSISIVFDEDVVGFDSGDIVVVNGTINVASFNAVDARTYTVGITAGGDVTINVPTNVAQDLVGNDNNAATPAVAVFDIIAPFVIITNATVVNAANAANYTVGGGCDNGDGDVTVSITGATPASQNDITCTAGSWSAIFDVTAISDGLNALTVNASQTDAATNTGNAIAVQVDKDVLITVPTVDLLWTNNLTPVITGTADTGTSNEIVVAGATYTVTAVVGNLWSLDTAAATPVSGSFSLAGGVNDVAVTSSDSAGNSATDATIDELTLSLDDDNDGIPNIVECPSGLFDNTCPDADGDGTPDFQETDSDNDSIPDAIEAGNDGDNPIDSDGDGIPDYRDTDSDNDDIDDAVEGAVDTDGDNIPDYVDVGDTGDSDGDGIPDTVECTVYPGCTDTDGDGKPDYFDIDADNDGIGDAVEAGVDPTAPVDTDGDGTPDYQDTDSDEDGADDSVEGLTDNDADGIPDYVDVVSTGPAPNAGDSDGDGIADNIECELYPLCADSDNDGTPDYMETDSDNDGIPDVNEAGPVLNDADNDGIDDAFDIDITRLINGLDQNGDGIDDTQPLDTDGDGSPDYQDADSDGDGIDDIVECPAGIPCPDADNDGIPDQLDASDGDASGDDITGRGDSDGDGISDIDECIAGAPCSDIDQDGLPDYMDNIPDDGPAGDPDNDAILNYLDPDDDNDRIPDIVEDPDFDMDNNPATNPLDSDLDGTPNYLDLDSDNDGLTDADESGASGNDSDGDNIDDTYDIDLTIGADLNADGIDDDITPRDTDSDNLPDYLDTVFDGESGTADTDKDGILDDVECPVFPTDCPDSDNDGTPDFLETDSDGDGLGDDEEAGSLSSGILLDTDGDGVPDYQDTDSDNDGVSDTVEGLNADNDADGIPDALDADSSGALFGGDSDGDGVVDIDECNTYPDCADSNNDGTPDYMDSSYRPYDPNANINTGLNGVGSNGPWILLLIPVTLLIRRKIR